MKWYFLISRKQTTLLLSMPEYQNYGRHSLGRQSAFPWRNVSWFATQGKDATPGPHYDHQTLIFPSSLPRGLALLMEILRFLEEMVFQALLFLLGLILMQQIDRKQRCTDQDQRLFLFINWQV